MNLVYKQFGRFERSGKPHHTKQQPETTIPEPSARAGSGIFNKGNLINTHFLEKAPANQKVNQPIGEETDDFIDQCIEEYFTWLAQTEVNRAKLNLSTIESFKPTDWSAFEHKEATPDKYE